MPDAEVPTGNCTTVELSYGTRCSYYCRRGFERLGSETITCQLDKTWYPSAPVCDGKHIMLISTHSHRCNFITNVRLKKFTPVFICVCSLIDDKMSSRQASGSPTKARKRQIAGKNEESTSKFMPFFGQGRRHCQYLFSLGDWLLKPSNGVSLA